MFTLYIFLLFLMLKTFGIVSINQIIHSNKQCIIHRQLASKFRKSWSCVVMISYVSIECHTRRTARYGFSCALAVLFDTIKAKMSLALPKEHLQNTTADEFLLSALYHLPAVHIWRGVWSTWRDTTSMRTWAFQPPSRSWQNCASKRISACHPSRLLLHSFVEGRLLQPHLPLRLLMKPSTRRVEIRWQYVLLICVTRSCDIGSASSSSSSPLYELFTLIGLLVCTMWSLKARVATSGQ